MHTLLVANRGEIAVRLIATAKHLGIRTVAVYTEPDSASQHVAAADSSFLLSGDPAHAYLDGDQILRIAREAGAQAVIPGYGFLSENADFARAAAAAGLCFVGPSPDAISQFGLKHTARDLAVAAGVAVVPGSRGLLDGPDHTAREAARLGYPVMLKSTAGGGGMGLVTCADEAALRSSFETARSRGETLFKDAGLFLEKYYAAAHHIEVQVFGDGAGRVVALGERECSVQRRHQKVVEECPSPFVAQKRPDLRARLCDAAVSLGKLARYASAGTVEFLVDDVSGDFFFLEMNTRLQVEHGVTEMVYGVDIVELMLLQADAQLAGNGIDGARLDEIAAKQPSGHAVEVRVYAENPARDYAPSPGLLQEVSWHRLAGTRVDTWVRAGITVSSNYDPLLAKILHHAPSRPQAVDGMVEILTRSAICGPPTNLDFLLAIMQSEPFQAGHTLTQFLSTFAFRPPAIDVLSGGSYTLIQDYPGRPTVGRGFGHGGPMDPVAFRVANALVGNPLGKEGLEMTLTGPDLVFLGGAVVALTGSPIAATLDGQPFPMWQRVEIAAGQRLTIAKTLSNAGCRSYLGVAGGFSNVAQWFGSKATVPMVGVGGYQGRSLRAGDLLRLVDNPGHKDVSVKIPPSLVPRYTEHWDVRVMAGPYAEGYLLPEDVDMFYATAWEVSHNSARGGIRLVGPRPQWARADGGDGGAHPSNVIEYGYPIGGINWTGDEPVIFPMDCPDFGGFVCTATVVKADNWKVGQLRAGNTVRFHPVSLDHALEVRGANERYVGGIVEYLSSATPDLDSIPVLDDLPLPPPVALPATLHRLPQTSARPLVTYRQGADDYLLVDYGEGRFDLNYKCRATALNRKLRSPDDPLRAHLHNTVCIGSSIMVYYDGLALAQADLLAHLVALEHDLGDLHAVTLPNRTFVLPLTFTHPRLAESLERYMANQRPYASYLPDNFCFLADNNGIGLDDLRKLWLSAEFVVVGVGFFMALPVALPADPRQRLVAPKMNPSRTFTPEGTVSWGGSCLAIYPVDSPGGFMMTGMTVPGVDVLAYKDGFSPDRPWLYEDMDVIRFTEVDEKEYDRQMALFRSGRYRYDVRPSQFDMAAHNAMLRRVADEARQVADRQKVYQDRMARVERELLDRWTAEKKAGGIPVDSIQELLNDPHIEPVEAPVNANVWKVLVQDGQVLKAGQTVAILEAMKMEINVNADDRLAGATVEKVLVAPNDIIQNGKPLVLVRTK